MADFDLDALLARQRGGPVRPIPPRKAADVFDLDALLAASAAEPEEPARRWSGQSYLDVAKGVGKSLANTAIMGANALIEGPVIGSAKVLAGAPHFLAEYDVAPEEERAYTATNIGQMLLPGGVGKGMARGAVKAIPRVAGGAALGAGGEYVAGGNPMRGAVIGGAVGAGLPGAQLLSGTGSLSARLAKGGLSRLKGFLRGGAAEGPSAAEAASFSSARAEVRAIEASERASAKAALGDELARFRAAREETRALEAAERNVARIAARTAPESFQSARAETRALEAADRTPKSAVAPVKATDAELEAFAKEISATSPNKVTAERTARALAKAKPSGIAEAAAKHNELMAFGKQIAAENPKVGEKIWVLLDDSGKPIQHLTSDQAGAAKRAGKQTTWIKNLWESPRRTR